MAPVFASAVRGALRDGSVDLAVHSLKDLPTLQPDDLEIVAIPEREDSRDVLVGCRLDDLQDGSRVGTGAPRRALQMLDWARRRGIELEIVPVRGNVGTRLDLVATRQVTAVLLAAAGLRRLGYVSLEVPDNSDIVVNGLRPKYWARQRCFLRPVRGPWLWKSPRPSAATCAPR